jgi:hypothetical protein
MSEKRDPEQVVREIKQTRQGILRLEDRQMAGNDSRGSQWDERIGNPKT